MATLAAGQSTSVSPTDHQLDNHSHGNMMVIVATVLLILCLLTCGARLCNRDYKLRSVGADDAMGIASMICTALFDILIIVNGSHSAGQHISLSTPTDIHEALVITFICLYLYCCSLTFTKICLLLQYRRIFRRTWLNRVSAIILAFVVAGSIVQVVLASLGCLPIAILVPSMANRCMEMHLAWNLSAVINILTELAIYLLTLQLVKPLKLPRKQKIILCFVFGLGFFVCCIAVSRLYFVRTIRTSDPVYTGSVPVTLLMVEANCAFYCACVPTLRPLFGAFVPWLRTKLRIISPRSSTPRSTPSPPPWSATDSRINSTTAILSSQKGPWTGWSTRMHSPGEEASVWSLGKPSISSVGSGSTACHHTRKAWWVGEAQSQAQTQTLALAHPRALEITTNVTITKTATFADAGVVAGDFSPSFCCSSPSSPRHAPPIVPRTTSSSNVPTRDRACWSAEPDEYAPYDPHKTVSAWVSIGPGPDERDDGLSTLPSNSRTRSVDTKRLGGGDRARLVKHVTLDGDSSRYIGTAQSTSSAWWPLTSTPTPEDLELAEDRALMARGRPF